MVGQLVLVRKLQLDLGSLADLEHELELGSVLEIEVALLLGRDDVAQVVDVLLLEVFEDGVRRLAVRLLGQHALAVHFPDEAHRNHARTETRDVGLALVLAQRLVDLLRIILLAHRNLDERGVLLALFSYDIHIESVVILFLTSRNRPAKIRNKELTAMRIRQIFSSASPRRAPGGRPLRGIPAGGRRRAATPRASRAAWRRPRGASSRAAWRSVCGGCRRAARRPSCCACRASRPTPRREPSTDRRRRK